MRRCLAIIFVAVVLAASSAVRASEGDSGVERAKRALASNPDDFQLRLELGIAYYRAGNDFWAVRVLSAVVDDHQDDCAARSWLGLALLRRAFPRQALESVDAKVTAQCRGPDLTRVLMVRAMALAALNRMKDVDSALRQAALSKEGYDSDVKALPGLKRRLLPDSLSDVTWSFEIGAGYTSNARMGSAVDSTGDDDGGSPMTTVDARVRLSPETGSIVRPVLEIQPKLNLFLAGAASKFGFFDFTGQAGLLFRSVLPRIFVGYRPEWLVLTHGFKSDDSPVLYMAAHRGEFEVEILPSLMVFGGVGHRTFVEMVKTRIEADVGLGGSARPVADLTALWAVAGRYYDARHAAWSQFGMSATGAFVIRMSRDFTARVSASISIDYYPWSAATTGQNPFGCDENRFDLLVRTGGQLWSPSMAGARLGVSYDFSTRDSSAAAYSFTDHRVLLRLKVTGSTDFRRPESSGVDAGPHADVDWGKEGSGFDERVRDMLRQDEQVQRSSSCVN